MRTHWDAEKGKKSVCEGCGRMRNKFQVERKSFRFFPFYTCPTTHSFDNILDVEISRTQGDEMMSWWYRAVPLLFLRFFFWWNIHYARFKRKKNYTSGPLTWLIHQCVSSLHTHARLHARKHTQTSDGIIITSTHYYQKLMLNYHLMWTICSKMICHNINEKKN